MMFTTEAFDYFQHDAVVCPIQPPHFQNWSATGEALLQAQEKLAACARALNMQMLETEQEIRYFLDNCTDIDTTTAHQLTTSQ